MTDAHGFFRSLSRGRTNREASPSIRKSERKVTSVESINDEPARVDRSSMNTRRTEGSSNVRRVAKSSGTHSSSHENKRSTPQRRSTNANNNISSSVRRVTDSRQEDESKRDENINRQRLPANDETTTTRQSTNLVPRPRASKSNSASELVSQNVDAETSSSSAARHSSNSRPSQRSSKTIQSDASPNTGTDVSSTNRTPPASRSRVDSGSELTSENLPTKNHSPRRATNNFDETLRNNIDHPVNTRKKDTPENPINTSMDVSEYFTEENREDTIVDDADKHQDQQDSGSEDLYERIFSGSSDISSCSEDTTDTYALYLAYMKRKKRLGGSDESSEDGDYYDTDDEDDETVGFHIANEMCNGPMCTIDGGKIIQDMKDTTSNLGLKVMNYLEQIQINELKDKMITPFNAKKSKKKGKRIVGDKAVEKQMVLASMRQKLNSLPISKQKELRQRLEMQKKKKASQLLQKHAQPGRRR